jgi:hypothetical protein
MPRRCAVQKVTIPFASRSRRRGVDQAEAGTLSRCALAGLACGYSAPPFAFSAAWRMKMRWCDTLPCGIQIPDRTNHPLMHKTLLPIQAVARKLEIPEKYLEPVGPRQSSSSSPNGVTRNSRFASRKLSIPSRTIPKSWAPHRVDFTCDRCVALRRGRICGGNFRQHDADARPPEGLRRCIDRRG